MPSPTTEPTHADTESDDAVRAARRASDCASPTAGDVRPADRALSLLLLAAERDVRVPMSITAGGVVVSGTLIGTLAYYRAFADQFTSAIGVTEMTEGFADAFRDLVDEAADVARGDRRDPPDPASYEQAVAFVHLEEARYVGQAGVLPHGRHGVLWRCPVADITGWSVGELIGR